MFVERFVFNNDSKWHEKFVTVFLIPSFDSLQGQGKIDIYGQESLYFSQEQKLDKIPVVKVDIYYNETVCINVIRRLYLDCVGCDFTKKECFDEKNIEILRVLLKFMPNCFDYAMFYSIINHRREVFNFLRSEYPLKTIKYMEKVKSNISKTKDFSKILEKYEYMTLSEFIYSDRKLDNGWAIEQMIDKAQDLFDFLPFFLIKTELFIKLIEKFQISRKDVFMEIHQYIKKANEQYTDEYANVFKFLNEYDPFWYKSLKNIEIDLKEDIEISLQKCYVSLTIGQERIMEPIPEYDNHIINYILGLSL